MLHSSMIVFLVVLVGICNGNGQYYCEKPVRRRDSWGGVCFGTNSDLNGLSKCDALVNNGCPPEEPCCCVDCDIQTDICRKEFSGSFGRQNISKLGQDDIITKCCPNELQVGEVRPGSGCICCKECLMRPFCRQKHRQGRARCISPNDIYYNAFWCTELQGGRIYERQCAGDNCWCCVW